MLGLTNGRKWVYMKSITGWFRRTHKVVGSFQLLFLFAVPFLSIGGSPAALIDWPGRRVFILGSVYTVADSLLLMLMLLSAAFGLFLFTALYGRLFCGYACPQTVFLHDLVHPIERFFEGDRGPRMRRDERGSLAERLPRKIGKWIAFALVSWLVSAAFMSWFTGPGIWWGDASHAAYTLTAVFAGGWFLDFAWFREQACNYLCPYARFQGALCDDESLVISYDVPRGEPRGPKAGKERGGCVDCNKCVVVCPQGIDIRDGFQLECIACGLCVDACTDVMGKLGHPTLVRYTSAAEEKGLTRRLIRPRSIVYTTILSVIALIFTGIVWNHHDFTVNVARNAGDPYVQDPDGMIRNTYLLKVVNLDGHAARDFVVRVDGLPNATVMVPNIHLEPLGSSTAPLILRVAPGSVGPNTPFTVNVVDGDNTVTRKLNFAAPGPS